MIPLAIDINEDWQFIVMLLGFAFQYGQFYAGSKAVNQRLDVANGRLNDHAGRIRGLEMGTPRMKGDGG